MASFPRPTAAALFAVLLMTACTTAASALQEQLAAAPRTERVTVLRQECARVAGDDRRAARMVEACRGMERLLAARAGGTATPETFARFYEACVDESKRDGRMFSTRWHRGDLPAYYESRAVCDAYQGMFTARASTDRPGR